MLFSMILQLFSVFIARWRSENSIETAAATVTVQGPYDVRQAPVVFGIARCRSFDTGTRLVYINSYIDIVAVLFVNQFLITVS